MRRDSGRPRTRRRQRGRSPPATSSRWAVRRSCPLGPRAGRIDDRRSPATVRRAAATIRQPCKVGDIPDGRRGCRLRGIAQLLPCLLDDGAVVEVAKARLIERSVGRRSREEAHRFGPAIPRPRFPEHPTGVAGTQRVVALQELEPRAISGRAHEREADRPPTGTRSRRPCAASVARVGTTAIRTAAPSGSAQPAPSMRAIGDIPGRSLRGPGREVDRRLSLSDNDITQVLATMRRVSAAPQVAPDLRRAWVGDDGTSKTRSRSARSASRRSTGHGGRWNDRRHH